MSKILVVEDDDRVRTALALILSNAGYTIVEAVSIKTALMHLDILDLAVVVLDLRLPNGHGRKVVEALIAKRDDVPVVILTGYPEDAPTGFPVSSVLDKPIHRTKLLEAVKEADRAATAIRSIRSSTRKLGDSLQ